jgi:hypothetical protein
VIRDDPDDMAGDVFRQLRYFLINPDVTAVVWIFLNHGDAEGLVFPGGGHITIDDLIRIGTQFTPRPPSFPTKPLLIILDCCNSGYVAWQALAEMGVDDRTAFLTSAPKFGYTSAVVLSDDDDLVESSERPVWQLAAHLVRRLTRARAVESIVEEAKALMEACRSNPDSADLAVRAVDFAESLEPETETTPVPIAAANLAARLAVRLATQSLLAESRVAESRVAQGADSLKVFIVRLAVDAAREFASSPMLQAAVKFSRRLARYEVPRPILELVKQLAGQLAPGLLTRLEADAVRSSVKELVPDGLQECANDIVGKDGDELTRELGYQLARELSIELTREWSMQLSVQHARAVKFAVTGSVKDSIAGLTVSLSTALCQEPVVFSGARLSRDAVADVERQLARRSAIVIRDRLIATMNGRARSGCVAELMKQPKDGLLEEEILMNWASVAAKVKDSVATAVQPFSEGFVRTFMEECVHPTESEGKKKAPLFCVRSSMFMREVFQVVGYQPGGGSLADLAARLNSRTLAGSNTFQAELHTKCAEMENMNFRALLGEPFLPDDVFPDTAIRFGDVIPMRPLHGFLDDLGRFGVAAFQAGRSEPMETIEDGKKAMERVARAMEGRYIKVRRVGGRVEVEETGILRLEGYQGEIRGQLQGSLAGGIQTLPVLEGYQGEIRRQLQARGSGGVQSFPVHVMVFGIVGCVLDDLRVIQNIKQAFTQLQHLVISSMPSPPSIGTIHSHAAQDITRGGTSLNGSSSCNSSQNLALLLNAICIMTSKLRPTTRIDLNSSCRSL